MESKIFLKKNYNPYKDICWKNNVPYYIFVEILYIIENKKCGRNEIIHILSNFFKSIIINNIYDLIPIIYLLNGKITPEYKGLELSIGKYTIINCISELTKISIDKIEKDILKIGDIGLIVNTNIFDMIKLNGKKYSVKEVYDILYELQKINGKNSNIKKREIIKNLILKCSKIEICYLLRFLSTRKLKVGFGEQIILNSLAQSYFDLNNNNLSLKNVNEILKQSYNQCSNYDNFIEILSLNKNVDDLLLKKCKIIPGIPLKPMLSTPCKSINDVLNIFNNKEFTCEYKYDGERAQIHIIDNKTINIFSRRLENNTNKFYEICDLIRNKVIKNKNIESAILDSEIVAFDNKKKIILPFQELIKRKKKNIDKENNINVCVFVFDLIYLNKKSLLSDTLLMRREKLFENFNMVIDKFMFAKFLNIKNRSKLEEIEKFFNESLKFGCEGLMFKILKDEQKFQYEIAKRGLRWLKLKKDYISNFSDTFDLVVIGGYLGKGKRTNLYGSYLLACYNEENDCFESITKVGSGFSDEQLKKHYNDFQKIKIDNNVNYKIGKIDLPNHFFKPKIVWEIAAADLTISSKYMAGYQKFKKGISLRAPRFISERKDKLPVDATTSDQIIKFYNKQFKK